MDMPVNVPVDHPEADTEWYVSMLHTLNISSSVTTLNIH
jgi:hypothetical protein